MKKLLIILFITFSIHFIFSQNSNEYESNKSINWEENNIEIKIRKSLINKNTTLASSRLKTENWIDDNKVNIFLKNVLDLQINSLENVSNIINVNPSIYYKLDNLAQNLDPYKKNLSTNLEYLEIIYKLPLYPDFVNVFYSQTQYLKQRKKLDHLDYGEFTGLIIYVPKELPLYQKNNNGILTKVLFPRIYNEDMELIMDYTMISPEYIKKWGMVIYGNSFDENLYQSRIGITPLRIIAKGLFGKNNSDIIISNKEANILIGTEENLKIISQSRILILN